MVIRMKTIKIYLTLYFFIFSFINSEEIDFENIVEKSFGKELRIGLSILKSKSLYVKINFGRGVLICNESEENLEEDKILFFEIAGDKIRYNGIETDKITLKKEDVFALFSLSCDNNKYRMYRGELELIVYKNEIFPINKVLAEEYIYSVVPSEIGRNFHPEAIKAQVLAARTYLYYGLKNKKYENLNIDLYDNTSSQMYLGYDMETRSINNLINETEKEVITYDGELINALYHSTSGGKTASNEDVWGGKPIPYLRSVNDKGNFEKSPRASWKYEITKKELSQIVGFNVNKIRVKSEKNMRVLNIELDGEKRIVISGEELRKRLGYTNLFSTIFKIKDKGKKIIIEGKGSGHGVGISQWGANGLAEKGLNYEEIIKYYYNGVEIKNIENL